MCREIPARLVLYFLSWSGFLVSFMMRNDINIALVAMVKSNSTKDAYSGNASNETVNVSSYNVRCNWNFFR